MGHHVDSKADSHSGGKQGRDVLIIDLLFLEVRFIFLLRDHLILSEAWVQSLSEFHVLHFSFVQFFPHLEKRERERDRMKGTDLIDSSLWVNSANSTANAAHNTADLAQRASSLILQQICDCMLWSFFWELWQENKSCKHWHEAIEW